MRSVPPVTTDEISEKYLKKAIGEINELADEIARAGKGERVPFAIKALAQAGVWTPRPWSKFHPDTGSGDPSRFTALQITEGFSEGGDHRQPARARKEQHTI